MILCGWCGVPTERTRCVSCRRDPALPYLHRAIEPEPYDRLAAAERANPGATLEQLAEYLDVSPRTVTRWRADGRAAS